VGAIAEGIAAYAQPLFEQTDGSIAQMNHAMAVAQMCWNLALMPEDRRDAVLDEMKPALKMTDEEFAGFRQHIVVPMIQRHREMFPGLHGRLGQTSNMTSVVSRPTKKYPGTGRNAPCPCGSGRKYKLCCGAQK
jgi:uncharacterized protein YecA (UPF0149 family)